MERKYKFGLIGGVGVLAVVGLTVGIVFAAKGDDEETCRSFTPPTELKFTEEADSVVLTWTGPSNSRGCAVKYKIKYSIDGGAEITEDVNEAEYKFDASVLVPCTKIEVELIPVSDTDEGQSDKGSYTIDVKENFDSVTRLTLSDSNNKLRAEWLPPVGYEKCTITYKLDIGTSSKTTSDLFYTFEDVTLEYCVSTTVVVTPIINNHNGISEEDNFEPVVEDEFGSVGGISMDVVNGKSEVKWSAPVGFRSCSIKYNIKLYDGWLVNVETEVENVEEAVLDIVPQKCVYVGIYITPMIGDKVGELNSEQYIEPINEGFGEVYDIDIMVLGGTLTAFWNHPASFDSCPIVYEIQVEDQFFGTTVSSYSFATIKLKYCDSTAITLTITPIIDGIRGKPAETSFEEIVEADFKALGTLTVSEETEALKVTWEVTEEYLECSDSMSYEVKLGEDVIDTIEDTEFILPADLDQCVQNHVTITPIYDVLRGYPVDKIHVSSIQNNFASVSNLNLNSDSADFVLSWEKPQDFSNCEMTYNVLINSELYGNGIEETTMLIPAYVLDKCEENEVKVTPIILDKVGTTETINRYPSMESGFNLVDFVFLNEDEDGKLFVFWNATLGFEQCSVSFEVQVNDGVTENVVGDEYTFPEPLKKCVEYQVRVTPIVDTVRGRTKIESYKIQPDFIQPISDLKIEVNDAENNFGVYWSPPEGIENCPLVYELMLSLDESETSIYKTSVTITEWISTKPFQYYCISSTLSITVVGNYLGLPNAGFTFAKSCS